MSEDILVDMECLFTRDRIWAIRCFVSSVIHLALPAFAPH